MATALENVSGLTVRSLTRAYNQAAILICEHAVKIDDAAALPVNTEVTYTDPDLDFIFSGRITQRSEQWADGEGIVYTCADVFRTIAKEPARLAGSTKIDITERTSGKQLVEDLLDEYIANGNPLAGGYDTTDFEDVQIEPMNMAGQSLFEWIDTILRQTEDTVCWIEYSLADPVLKFARIANRPDVDLVMGTYEIVNPDEDDNPLIVDGEIGENLDNKYSAILVEGCGDFTRHELLYLPVSSITRPDPSVKIYHYRFDIPDNWTTPRYIDEDGKCKEGWFARIVIGGGESGGSMFNTLTIDWPNVPILTDEVTGEQYFEIKYLAGGIVSDPPPIPAMEAWFTYTGYNGAFVATRASSVFSGEGTLVQQHPDLFKYDAPFSSWDDSTVLDGIADRLYERYCVEPDRDGRVNVHIKGLDADLNLGSKVVAPTNLQDPRIRGMRYDFVARNITLDCSDSELRPEVGDAQAKARLLSELRGNWYLSKDNRDPSCFCGGDVFVDQDGNFVPNSGDDGPDGGPSWDCINGECVERADSHGQYQDLNLCEQVCWNKGYDFIPCVGCIEAQEGWGQYETIEDCENDNPDPFDVSFNCVGLSGGSAPGPGSGPQGTEFGCSGCSCSNEQYFTGFIKRIKVSPSGKIITAECETCTFDMISGWTGTVSVLANVIVKSGFAGIEVSKCWHVMVYSDGILSEVQGPVDNGTGMACDSFKTAGTATRGILAKSWGDCNP